MTTGQRIAQKRREAGLSQEQLGQQLGVSRQAIYKWESDASMPEVEKLVALSRLFAVPVGWLLGEEDMLPQDAAGNPEPLTEEQMKRVERLVESYRPAPSKRRRRLLAAVYSAAALLLAVLLIRQYQLRRDYTRMEQALQETNRLYGSVSGQIGSVTTRVEELLQQQNDLTAARQVEISDFAAADNAVTFRLSAVPKTYEEGMPATFVAQYPGGPMEVPAQMDDAHTFSALLTCPLTDDEILFLVVFQQGDTHTSQKIGEYSNLYSNSIPYCNLSAGLSWRAGGSGSNYTMVPKESTATLDVDTYQTSDIPHSASVTSARVGLFCNQKLVCWLQRSTSDDEVPMQYVLTNSVPLEEGSTYCMAAILTDEFGREWICCDDAMTIGKYGNATRVPLEHLSDDLSGWQY